jgi:hypothetical protein
MNDDVQTSEETEVVDTPPTELELLKDRAKSMGMKFSGNIKVETLRKRIEDKMNGRTEEPADDEDEKVMAKPQSKRKTRMEQEQEIRDRLHKEKMCMRRVQIYNLNPQKNDLTGEFISVGNRYLGTVNRFVPFGEDTEGGTHIEQVIYDDLKSRKFQQIRIKKEKDGSQTPSSRWVPEYNIVDLEALTQDQLDELALNQETAERVNKD